MVKSFFYALVVIASVFASVCSWVDVNHRTTKRSMVQQLR
jgi:hypothetical protein